MSSISRPGESFDPPSSGAASEDGAQLAPRWAREFRLQSQARNVVPLRLPEAPPLADPRPARAAAMFEAEAALRKLLQSPALAPAASPPPPIRDAVGLALGMVARLMVAGCAAAAVVLLLIGVIPFKSEPAGETNAVAANAWSVDPAPAQAAVPVREYQRVASGDRNVPASAPVAVPTVFAPQATAPEPRVLAPEEIARLTKRGEDYLERGDIASARLVLARAAEAQDARAALALGATYDPAVLKQLGVLGFRPHIPTARAWYERAVQYGSTEASRRLAALPRL